MSSEPVAEKTIAATPLPAAAWPLLLQAIPTLRHSARTLPPPIRREHLLKAPDPAWLQRYLAHFPANHRQSEAASQPIAPICFYYLLLQRAQLATMLSCRGLRVAGLIHVSNQLELHQPLTLAALCQPGTHVQPGTHSQPGTSRQPATPFRLQTECRAVETSGRGWLDCQQQLWLGNQLILTGGSRYLLYKDSTAQAPRATSPASPSETSTSDSNQPAASASAASPPAGEPLQQWLLASNAGRQYAALSGDWNPIHLWAWSARLFGQRQPILHGMASAALLCAAMPAPVRQLSLSFIRPVALCSTLQLYAGAPANTTAELNAGVSPNSPAARDYYQLWHRGALAVDASLQLCSARS